MAPNLAMAQSGNAGQSTLDGVYTEAQAERGEETFSQTCGHCHTVAEFHGPIWAITWTGRSAGHFVDLVSTTMPLDRPGSLSQQEYADILAYVLSLNGYPYADEELPGDSDALGQVTIEPLSN